MKIKLGGIKDLIEHLGKSIVRSYLAECVENSTAKFYMVYSNDEKIGVFWIFLLEDSMIDLCIHDKDITNNSDFMKKILNYLKKEGHKKVYISSDDEKEIKSLSNYGFKEIEERRYKFFEKEL